jgi:hypothetical protein
MRRWAMAEAPRDGRTIIGCTRVEGVERRIRWIDNDGGSWADAATQQPLPSDLFVEWRRDQNAGDGPA